jgi:transposase
MSHIVAGIDVHKRLLVVVVADASLDPPEFSCRRFGTVHKELIQLVEWLSSQGVRDVVMESTAQYWRPVWLALERHFHPHLAQAQSNRAPKGRKTDSRDAQRLVRRFLAGELILSFVPDAEQREIRLLARRRVQWIHDRVRLQAQLECLLEECDIKLSSVITDLFGASGRRILDALAAGQLDPAELASLGDGRLKCTAQQLSDALQARLTANQREILRMCLEQLKLIDSQLETITHLIARAVQPHQDAILRLCQVPGIRVIAAQQILAEIGPDAKAFPTSGQLSSWAGVCPGQQDSAGDNHSGRCAKGNRFLRSIVCQCAQAAVKTNHSWFQTTFRRLLPRLGFPKAIWAIAHHLMRLIWKILHEGDQYQERGLQTSPQAIRRRLQRLRKECLALGYDLQPTAVAATTP